MSRMSLFLLLVVLGVIYVQIAYADQEEMLDLVLNKRSTCGRASGICKYYRRACDPGYHRCFNRKYSCRKNRDKCCCRNRRKTNIVTTSTTITTNCEQASGICKYYRHGCGTGYRSCVNTRIRRYSCPRNRDRCCCRN